MARPTVEQRDQGVFNYEKPSFSKPRTEPLEVMIVGLSRTGTSSMLEAMQILGYGDIYSSRTMLRKHQMIFSAEILNTRLDGYGAPYGLEQFESLFGEHTCISGEFVSCMAEDVIKAYPEAKVILTVQADEEKWLRSILNTLWYGYCTWTHWFMRHVDSLWIEQGIFLVPYWHKFYKGDPEVHGLRVYREHMAMVKRVVEPKERLLVFDTQEGWGPLCEFLGKETPKQGFPWVNKQEYHREWFGNGRRKALRAWMLGAFLRGVLPTALVGLGLWKRKHVGELVQQVWRK